MSTTIMGLCWPLQMPPTPKAVLVSIADQANDQAVCWPSIAGLCTRTCFGRTAVIDALKWLVEAGYLSIEKTGGKNNRYTIALDKVRQREIEPVRAANQSGTRTSPSAEPVRQTDDARPAGGPPPVRQADQPVRQADPNRKEPSSEPKKKKEPAALSVADLVGDGLTEQTAIDWLRHRKRKRAELTPTAWDGIKAEAAKAGWSVQGAVAKALVKGWTGFDADWVEGRMRQTGETPHQRHARERAQEAVPAIAAKAPGSTTTAQNPMEILDGLTRIAG